MKIELGKKLIVSYLIQDKLIYYVIPSWLRHPKSDLSLPGKKLIVPYLIQAIPINFAIPSLVRHPKRGQPMLLHYFGTKLHHSQGPRLKNCIL